MPRRNEPSLSDKVADGIAVFLCAVLALVIALIGGLA